MAQLANLFSQPKAIDVIQPPSLVVDPPLPNFSFLYDMPLLHRANLIGGAHRTFLQQFSSPSFYLSLTGILKPQCSSSNLQLDWRRPPRHVSFPGANVVAQLALDHEELQVSGLGTRTFVSFLKRKKLLYTMLLLLNLRVGRRNQV